jgi:hypothetical protein
VLDRATAAFDSLAVDAEWLANVAATLDVATALDHPCRDLVLEAARPFAALQAIEGIGAGLYGATSRFVAAAESARGRHDDAVDLARHALEANAVMGRVLLADASRTLAACLVARGEPGDTAEAAGHDATADALYAAAGLDHLVRDQLARDQLVAGDASPLAAPPATPLASEPTANELRRDGDVWHVTFAGTSTVVKHAKGVADLAVLLAAPGRDVHVSELEAVPRPLLGGAAGETIDRRALAAYRERLSELAAEIDDADAANDPGRADRARAEHDAIVDHLSAALGVGGRARAAADPVERLRKAVTARVRDTIRRVESVHPSLGRHLAHSVRTGTWCAYAPEGDVTWTVTP